METRRAGILLVLTTYGSMGLATAASPPHDLGDPRRIVAAKVADYGRALGMAVTGARVPHLERLPIVQARVLGPLGNGMEKSVWKVQTSVGPGAMLTLHPHLPWQLAEVQEETNAFLEDHGLRTVPSLGRARGLWPGQFHVIQPEMAAGSRGVIEAWRRGQTRKLAASPANATTASELAAMRDTILTHRLYVPDLQFMLDRRGHVYVNDTGRPQRVARVTDDDLRQLDALHEAAVAADRLRR